MVGRLLGNDDVTRPDLGIEPRPRARVDELLGPKVLDEERGCHRRVGDADAGNGDDDGALSELAAPEGVPRELALSNGRQGVVDGDHWDGVDARFAELEGKRPGQKKKEVGEAVPFGRMGQAEDLTGMAVFLASDEANYIVAQTYNVDGGQWMS